MALESLDVVRRSYEGANRLDPPRDLLAQGCELDLSGVMPDVGIARGYNAVREALLEYWGVFDDFRVDLEEVLHADDTRVVTRVRDWGRVKGSDSEVQNRYFHVFTLAQGRIVRLSIHTEEHQALEAAGIQ